MEPASLDSQEGSPPHRLAGEPRGARERPGPRDPDPRARVRRLRHRVHPLPARASSRRTTSSSSASSRASTASASRTCRWCASSCRWAASRPTSSTPSPTGSRGTCRCARATSRPARTSRCTTSRCPTRPKLIRELGDAGLSSPRGLRQHDAQRHRRSARRARSQGELFDITPYAGAYVRYFVRHPTTQAMPRKVKTAFTATDEDNAITRIHDMAFIPRDARRRARRRGAGRRRHLDHAAAGADAVRVRRARQRRLPQGHRGRACGSSTARTSCASTAPGPGSRCWSTRSGSTRSASWSRRSCEGDWVAERDFSLDGILFEHDEQAHAPARAAELRAAPTATAASSTASSRVQRRGPAPGGLLDGRGEGPRAAT